MLHQVGIKAAEKVTSEQALGEGEGACGETGGQKGHGQRRRGGVCLAR